MRQAFPIIILLNYFCRINAEDLAHLSIVLAFAIVVMIQGNVIEIRLQIKESL